MVSDRGSIADIKAVPGEVRVYIAGAYYSKKHEPRYYTTTKWSDIHDLKDQILSNCLPLIGEVRT